MEGAKPGHTVKFHGLKGAAHLNGTEGTLVKFIKKESRWSVRTDDLFYIVTIILILLVHNTILL